MNDTRLQSFLAERSRLLRLAYRYLGNVADAEDAVQEAWIRYSRADAPARPGAFLSTTVSRIALDKLKSAARRNETYVGPWLPEPVLEQEPERGEAAFDISFAVMRALQALTPEERAAYFLHDLFDVDYGEIAQLLSRSEPACRKLAERARKRLKSEKPRFLPKRDDIGRFEAAFTAAIAGDETALRAMLAEQVEFVSDGGGKALAALNVVRGREKVLRMLLGLGRKALETGGFELEPATINGASGFILIRDRDVDQTFCFDFDREGRIAAFYIVRNPDKLKGACAALQARGDKPPLQ